MGRKVRLVDTGELAEKGLEGLYQAPNRKWYSSEEAYLEIDLEAVKRQNIVDKIFILLGYNKGQKITTLFFKRLKEWREGYSYYTIDKAVDMSKDAIEFAFRTKNFDNETAKVMYMSAIIQNKLNDALNITKLEQKVKQKSKSHDLNSMADGIEALTNIESEKKSSDVRHLAGEL